WLRFPAPETVQVSGTAVNSVTLDLIPVWNLISGPTCKVAASDVLDPGNILIPGTLFSYDGSYSPTDTLRPGKGYWVRTSSAGQITVSCGPTLAKNIFAAWQPLNLSRSPALTITDAGGNTQQLSFNIELPNPEMKISYSLPPLPPAGAFDARFAGDYRISENSEDIIQLQASAWPLTLHAKNLPAAEQYALEEILSSGEAGETHLLQDGGKAVIGNPQVKAVRLFKTETVPLTFTVAQNYPNPFNPATEIRYSLPAETQVEITIYNALGQRVKTLLSGRQAAGNYTVSWNATNDNEQAVGSGLYFYRVKAGENTAMKKMLLVR
ncbi:MAG: FlgD immunoglobulin-like domain containing protein, partial [Calditrichia bacterium]